MSIIGLDIGGTKCAVVLASDDGDLEQVRGLATTTVTETLSGLFSAIEALGSGETPVFGVSCGGPLDSKTGVILSPPNLPGWDNIHITRELTRRFGGEAFLMNDANAGALAEWQFGAARGCRNVIFLTHGSGMGAGLILDGRLYEGSAGSAGEVGHIRLASGGPVGFGKAGSFEGFCSGGGIARLASSMGFAGVSGGDQEITAREVALAAEQGDRKAIEVFNVSGRYLGQGLSTLIDILNPEIIVLGSIYTRAGKLLKASMMEVLRRETLPDSLKACKITATQLGEDIGNYATIAVVLYNKKSRKFISKTTAKKNK